VSCRADEHRATTSSPTLRYEKPLYLFLNLDNLIGIVATYDQEPTGEEEG